MSHFVETDFEEGFQLYFGPLTSSQITDAFIFHGLFLETL